MHARLVYSRVVCRVGGKAGEQEAFNNTTRNGGMMMMMMLTMLIPPKSTTPEMLKDIEERRDAQTKNGLTQRAAALNGLHAR